MITYNGLVQLPGSEELTCCPHGGHESTINYLIWHPKAIHTIEWPHALLAPTIATYILSYILISPTPPTRINQAITPQYTSHMASLTSTLWQYTSHMIHPWPLRILLHNSHSLHSMAINSFRHMKRFKQGRVGFMPQSRWYDVDCKDLYRQLKSIST